MSESGHISLMMRDHARPENGIGTSVLRRGMEPYENIRARVRATMRLKDVGDADSGEIPWFMRELHEEMDRIERRRARRYDPAENDEQGMGHA